MTPEEITMLVFTSIDLDWLPHMIILAGEFTKWFNINFAGESQEEVDFRENKLMLWDATCAYSNII